MFVCGKYSRLRSNVCGLVSACHVEPMIRRIPPDFVFGDPTFYNCRSLLVAHDAPLLGVGNLIALRDRGSLLYKRAGVLPAGCYIINRCSSMQQTHVERQITGIPTSNGLQYLFKTVMWVKAA